MIEIIPAGVSAVVSERHHDHDRDYDKYRAAERVKDRVAEFNTANAERTAKISKDISDSELATSQGFASSINATTTSASAGVLASTVGASAAVLASAQNSAAIIAAVNSQADFARSQVCNGFAAVALAAAQNTSTVVQTVFAVDKDVQLLGKDLQITEKNLALGSAQNTAALQMTACNNQSAVMLAFKDAALQLAQVKSDLAAQQAECCCELKEEIGGVKDALKQQEIDRLREQLLDAKARCRRRTYSPVPAGTLIATDDD
jgi:hypothetical protein